MKVLCPICHVEGILEVRGRSQRVLHHRGSVDGKRVYERHALGVSDGSNGSKLVGLNNVGNEVIWKNRAPPIGLEPMTDWLTASRSTELSYGGIFRGLQVSALEGYLRLVVYGFMLMPACLALNFVKSVKSLKNGLMA